MLKHGDFSPQDDHRYDQPDRDDRPYDAEYPDVDRVVGRAEFAGGPFEETHALAEDEVDKRARFHSSKNQICSIKSMKQSAPLAPKRLAQADGNIHGRIRGALLNALKVGTINLGFFAQTFLCETGLNPQTGHIATEFLPW